MTCAFARERMAKCRKGIIERAPGAERLLSRSTLCVAFRDWASHFSRALGVFFTSRNMCPVMAILMALCSGAL